MAVYIDSNQRTPPASKIALVINGDTEERHLGNVERSLKTLKALGYTTYVINPIRPEGADVYLPPTFENVETLVAQIREAGGGKEDLVIYTTGHGDQKGDEGQLCFADKCEGDSFINRLESIPFAKRVVVMDQCFGGNMRTRFVDDPKTLFVSGGSQHETDVCQEVAPKFWSDQVPDANGDGVVSWQERFAHVMEEGVHFSFPQFVPAKDFVDEGKAHFADSVQTIQNQDELDKALKNLKPGQYAVMTFSASWCGPCHQYAPHFDAMAKEAKGQTLFLRTENEDLAAQYGAHGYPTVMLFNHQGMKQTVENRERALDEIASFTISADERSKILRQRIITFDPREMSQALSVYKDIAEYVEPEEAKEGMNLTEFIFQNRFNMMDVRSDAVEVYAQLASRVGITARNTCEELFREKLDDEDEKESVLALKGYQKLAEKMDPIHAQLEAIFLRSQFVVDEKKGIAGNGSLEAYKIVAGRLDKKMKISEVDKLLESLGSGKEVAMWAAMNALQALKQAMTADQKKAVVQHLRHLLFSSAPGLRQTAIFNYAQFLDVMTFDELLEGARILREQFSGGEIGIPILGPLVQLFQNNFAGGNTTQVLKGDAIKVYGDVVRTMRENFEKQSEENIMREQMEIIAGARSLRRALHASTNAIRNAVLGAYVEISQTPFSLPKEVTAVEEFKNFLQSPDPITRDKALTVYGIFLGLKSPEKVRKGAVILRRLFENQREKTVIRSGAIKFWAVYAEKLDQDEIRQGIRDISFELLRNTEFGDYYGGVELYSRLLPYADRATLQHEHNFLKNASGVPHASLAFSLLPLVAAAYDLKK